LVDVIAHALVLFLLVPLGAVAAIAFCALVLLTALAIGWAGWWALRRAADRVLGPAHDL
jgi:hypothetical protein